MAENYNGPYQVILKYETQPTDAELMEHVMALNIDLIDPPDPGEAFTNIYVKGSINQILLSSLCNLMRDALKPMLSAADTTLIQWELWAFEEYSNDGVFVSALAINQAGTGVTDCVKAHADIYTMRTAEGGVLKNYVMENIFGGNERMNYSQLTTERAAWADILLGNIDSGKHFLGKDTSYPIVFLRCSPGSHEALFKKRFR